MIRKLKTGEYRVYSNKVEGRTGKRRYIGTYKSRKEAERQERANTYFRRNGMTRTT